MSRTVPRRDRPSPVRGTAVRGIVATIGVGALTLGPLALPAQAAPVEIDLLTINDFHGRLETSGATGGASVLAGAFDAFRAANPNTLAVSTGDNIGASTFTSFIQDDNPTIDALNAAGLDASAVGNHEYDQGWADLRDDVILGLGEGDEAGAAAQWPYLAANVVLTATGEAPAEVQPYTITETAGVSVAFVGAVTEDLPSLVSPAGIADLTVLPIVENINAVADQLSDGDDANGEADVVVALVHEDVEGTIADGANANIDVIFAGHTHEQYVYGVPDEDGGRPVIQTGSYATHVGHVNMTVDPDTDEITVNTVENLALMNDDDGDFVFEPNYEPDAEVQAIVDEAVEVAAELGAVELGAVTQNVTRAFDVGEVDGETALVEDRGEESTLGNLVADAQRDATVGIPTGEAQIAFMNPGGLRADICYAEAEYEEGLSACVGVADDGGVITYQEAATVQPFANTLIRQSMTGAQIEAALEQQLQPADSSRPFLHLGVSDGFEYTYEMTLDGDGVPTAFNVLDMTLAGVAIDPAASYEVVLNSFLASGGDNFVVFGEATDAQDTGQIDLQSFVDYMAANSPVSPDLQERAIDVASLGELSIDWPDALGDPPAMRAGTSRPWSLVTDLPAELNEDFEVTLDGPDGITAEFGDIGSTPAVISGLPAAGEVPFTLSVDEDTVAGNYELVFTIDRVNQPTVFDGNPLPTPVSVTVDLRVSAKGSNPGGPIDTGVSGPAQDGRTGLLMAIAALGALVAGGWLTLRRRPTAA